MGGLDKAKEDLVTQQDFVFVGCSSSKIAADYGAIIFKRLNSRQKSVRVIEAAELTEYDLPRKGSGVYVTISESGENPAAVRGIKMAIEN